MLRTSCVLFVFSLESDDAKKIVHGRSHSATMRAVWLIMIKIKSLLLISVLTAPLLWSQDSTFKLSVNVDLTEVHVNVTDERDRPVGNLKRENFRILEDRTQ